MALAMEGDDVPRGEPEEPICQECEDATAEWVGDDDKGDRDGQAVVTYAVYCSACKDHSSYMDPEPLTDAWRRYFARPWTFYEAPHAKR